MWPVGIGLRLHWTLSGITPAAESVPPGTYGLAVGVYDYETGIRAPVRDASGELQEMNRLVLPESVQR